MCVREWSESFEYFNEYIYRAFVYISNSFNVATQNVNSLYPRNSNGHDNWIPGVLHTAH